MPGPPGPPGPALPGASALFHAFEPLPQGSLGGACALSSSAAMICCACVLCAFIAFCSARICLTVLFLSKFCVGNVFLPCFFCSASTSAMVISI